LVLRIDQCTASNGSAHEGFPFCAASRAAAVADSCVHTFLVAIVKLGAAPAFFEQRCESLFVNDRLEGNAPLTILSLVGR
jgi:hypothetical protein